MARATGDTIAVTDPITGEQAATLRGHESQITSAAFLPNQRFISVAYDGTLRIWNLTAGHNPVVELKRTTQDPTGTAFYVAGGKQIVTAPNRDKFSNFGGIGISLWNADTGEHVRVLADEAARVTSPVMKELIGDLCDVDVSPDGERMATVHLDYNPGSGRDEEEPKPSQYYTPVRLWEMRSGKMLFAVQGIRRGVQTARFSPDGKRLLTFADGNHRYAILRDGKRYGAGSGGQMHAKVDVWDAFSGAHIRNIVPETAGGGDFALWSPDGKRILTNALHHVHRVVADVFDADTGARVSQLQQDPGSIDHAAFSADGKLLLGRRTNFVKGRLLVDIWDTMTGQKRNSLRGHTGEVTSAQFSPDGRSVVTMSADGTANLGRSDGRNKASAPRTP